MQNVGSVHSLECFICGSNCMLLSEAYMAVSFLGHVGILDKQDTAQFFRQIIHIYFASAAPETQLLKSTRAWGYFLNYSVSRIYAISKAKSFLPVH